VDDTFNVPRSRFKDLLRMLIKNDFGFRWSSYFKCQYVDREIMELMKESGCEFVFLGIESGSQTILDNMRKESDVGTYRRCIEIFHELGIMTMCSVIVGFPGETRATFEEMVRPDGAGAPGAGQVPDHGRGILLPPRDDVRRRGPRPGR
jgi:radical SAM superfamily enzyme YgiQ (UPF0313 family)